MPNRSLKIRRKESTNAVVTEEPKNELAMQIARDEVEAINWRLMRKKIQLVLENRIVDGLKRETDKCIDITNRLNNLTNSLRSIRTKEHNEREGHRTSKRFDL